ITAAGTQPANTTVVAWQPTTCGNGTVQLPSTPINNQLRLIINPGLCPGHILTVDGNGHLIDGTATKVVPNNSFLDVRYNARLATCLSSGDGAVAPGISNALWRSPSTQFGAL